MPAPAARAARAGRPRRRLAAAVLLLLAGVLASAPAQSVAAQAPVVTKVDPPSWWPTSTLSPVRLMIRGQHLAGARLECARLRCTNVAVNAAGTYVFADVEIPRAASVGRYPLRVVTAHGSAEANFELFARVDAAGSYQGFGRDDVMYLLMPDRFANGDTANDDPAVSRGLLDRSKARYYHGGDLAGVRQRLPYLKDLGITTIWMNPIYDNNNRLNDRETYDGQAITDYHGYGATDFYAVEERFGDMADLRRLVREAHAQGLKIVYDMVANHTGPYHPWVSDPPTPTWFHGTQDAHLANTWQTWAIADPYAAPAVKEATLDGWFIDILPDLNQDDPEVRRYLIQNTLWWVAITGADGIRQDTWPYVPRHFWREWMAAIKREFPALRVVGEVFDGDAAIVAFHEGGRAGWDGIDPGVDALFDFPLFYAIRDAFARGRSVRAMPQQLARDRLYHAPAARVTFVGLHDVNRFMGEPGATIAGLKLAYTALFTLRGTPLVYYGDEVALAGGGDPDNRRDFPGGFPGDRRDAFSPAGRSADEAAVHAHVKRLASLRAQHADLRGDSMQTLVAGEQLWVYRRGRMVVAINNDTLPTTARIPVGLLDDDLLGICARPRADGAMVAVDLPARSGCILPIRSLAVPGPALGVTGTRAVIRQFASRHVDARRVEVWLPPDYATDTAHYPVLYMHDGQNVFDPATAYGGVDWGVDETMTALIAARAIRPAIVVAVWNTPARGQEYMAAKAIPAGEPSLGRGTPVVYHGPWLGDGYQRFLVEELKPFIDRSYRTRPGRADTFVMGSSMGGIASLYAMAEYPQVFGAAAALSTHWPIAPTAMREYLRRTMPDPATHRVYMDIGTATLDSLYPPHQRAADSLFLAAGYRPGVNLHTEIFTGAEHNERAWRTRVHIPLRFLLAPAPGPPPASTPTPTRGRGRPD